MEEIVHAIEIFAAVTGVIYLILEILQKNAMWVVGILTGAACAFSFCVTRAWASMGLNIYYVAMSVAGLIQWKKADEAVGEGKIHLFPLPAKTAVWSAVLLVVGSALLAQLLRMSGDPAPVLDSTAVMLSAIATWWLVKSHLQQWLLWIVADILTTALCIATSQYAMALMYLAYAGGAVYGYLHWKRKGVVAV